MFNHIIETNTKKTTEKRKKSENKMTKIILIGSSEFVLGFQLAGIRDIIRTDDKKNGKNLNQEIKEAMKSKDVGVILTEEKAMESITEDLRQEMLLSSRPSVVVLSKKEQDEALKLMIKKSIGIDLG